MDAKPFRPMRASVANNENLMLSKQLLHQRHKSAGNLRGQAPTVASMGQIQEATKRTVFADKSNTARTNIPYNESKMSSAKFPNAKFQVYKAKDTSGSGYAPQKDAFKRPAQRPPSSKGGSLLPSVTSSDYDISLITCDVEPQAPQASVKLASSNKASTFVYNDNHNIRPWTSGSDIIDANQVGSAQEKQSFASFSRKPRHHQSQPALKSAQQKQQKIDSLLDAEIKNLANWEPLTAEKGTSEDEIAESLYLDAVEELSPEQFPNLQPGSSESALSVREPEQPYHPSDQDLDYQELCVVSAADLLDHSEHEDEDFYDPEQGYTTVHSYLSGVDTRLPDVADLTEVEPEPSMTVTVMDVPRFSEQALDEIEAAREHVEKHRLPEEVEDELWDISMVAEYGDEIFEYMREMEIALLPNPHYMDIQTEIQWSMRSVLMDWVIQVHGRFNLLPETLFLAVNFIDRFLTVKVVSLGKLQLVGATALFLAAKYEEINCPSVQEIVYMVDGGYSIDEILKAERYMLSMLDFNLGFPGPMSFLRRISKADDYDLETRTLAKYFLEVTVMDERFVASPPSFLAAGSHCLSRLILERGEWTLEHVHYSGYTFVQLQPLINMILECCTIAGKHHQAVFEKYSDKRFRKCAIRVSDQLKAGFYLDTPQAAVPSLHSRYDSYSYQWGQPPATCERGLMRMPIPLQG